MEHKEINGIMENKMTEVAEEGNQLCQKEEEQTQEEEKIIEETEQLQRHTVKACREDIPCDAANIQPDSHAREIERLNLQQDVYSELQETKEGCKQNMKSLPIANQEPDEQKQKIQVLQDEDKMQQNEEWDVYYMKIACLAALRSKDPSTPVRLFTAF